jgi:hypothetical protein
MIDVTLDWYEPEEEDWGKARCVYAYLDPEDRNVIYLGKADDSSPRQRWNGDEAMQPASTTTTNGSFQTM